MKGTIVCIRCGNRRTTDPSGLCSRCRKLKGASPCVRCGERRRASADGLCSVCRAQLSRKVNGGLTLDQAVERTELLLQVLRNRQRGISYRVISEMVGIPRSTAYVMVMRALSLETLPNELADPDKSQTERLLKEFKRSKKENSGQDRERIGE